jgi:hypothetical protein
MECKLQGQGRRRHRQGVVILKRASLYNTATMSIISQIGARENDNIVLFNILPHRLGVATPTFKSFGAMIPPALIPKQKQ